MLETLPCEILMLIADWVSFSVFDLFDPGTDRPPAASYHPARSQPRLIQIVCSFGPSNIPYYFIPCS
jgi:hypothetical protein